MQQLWGAGPPWLWLISKDFGDVKIIRPFHGVKMTELSIILLWLWGWISTIMKVLFHKKKNHLASFLGLLGIYTKSFAHYCKTTSDRWIMGITEDSKVKRTWRKLKIAFCFGFCSCSWARRTVRSRRQWNFWLQIKWFPLGALGLTLVLRIFWKVAITVVRVFQILAFSTDVSHKKLREVSSTVRNIWSSLFDCLLKYIL